VIVVNDVVDGTDRNVGSPINRELGFQVSFGIPRSNTVNQRDENPRNTDQHNGI
jgi:hypothetical protein